MSRIRSEGFITLGLMVDAPPGGLTLRALSKGRGVQAQTVRLQLQRCEEDGLVAPMGRRPNDPPNVLRFALTDDGRAAVEEWQAEQERERANGGELDTVRAAIATQPTSVFDLWRVMQR